MPSLSEFIGFACEKSKIKKPNLIEKDIILHKILKKIYSSGIAKNYLFKGGSCLVKCYLGYYRFSLDLDFTWKNQETWKGLGSKKLRKVLLKEAKIFASLLEETANYFGLDFSNEVKNQKYFEFGGGGRMVTFKLWKDSELIKIQVNFIEKILFKEKRTVAKTLLFNVKFTEDEKAYFLDFLDFYKPIEVVAYDEKEILCEKVRAILARRTQKLRDFYDLFKLDESGISIEELKEEIVEKIKASLYYKKYRENLERNRKFFKLGKEILEDPFERDLFIVKLPKEFEHFLETSIETLRKIAALV